MAEILPIINKHLPKLKEEVGINEAQERKIKLILWDMMQEYGQSVAQDVSGKVVKELKRWGYL